MHDIYEQEPTCAKNLQVGVNSSLQQNFCDLWVSKFGGRQIMKERDPVFCILVIYFFHPFIHRLDHLLSVERALFNIITSDHINTCLLFVTEAFWQLQLIINKVKLYIVTIFYGCPPPKDLTNCRSKDTGCIRFLHPIKQTQYVAIHNQYLYFSPIGPKTQTAQPAPKKASPQKRNEAERKQVRDTVVSQTEVRSRQCEDTQCLKKITERMKGLRVCNKVCNFSSACFTQFFAGSALLGPQLATMSQ